MNGIKQTIYNGHVVKYLEGSRNNYFNCNDIKKATDISYYISTAISNNNMRDKVEYCIKVNSHEAGKSNLYVTIKGLKRLVTIFTKEDDVAKLKEFIKAIETISGSNNEQCTMAVKDYAISKVLLSLRDRTIGVFDVYSNVERAVVNIIDAYNSIANANLTLDDDVTEIDFDIIDNIIDMFLKKIQQTYLQTN